MIPSSPQFSNPVKKVGGYLGNVVKETKQFGSAWGKALDASYDAKTFPPDQRPALNAKANKAAANQKSAFGQLAGAVLQGRRYNNKGNQINK